jgi:asparagine synthase (glutamine-hydrolysing)
MLGSSSTLLADVAAAPLWPESLAGFAQFGSFLAMETPFAGVTKLAGGASAALQDGRLTVEPGKPLPPATGSVEETFRDAVRAMADAAPEAELELSGGLDSRLILAAMRHDQRRSRKAITLGTPDAPSQDVTIAGEIAGSEDLDWSLLDVGDISHLEADGLQDVLSRAVVGYDHMANPVDKVALIIAGQGRELGARFGGQNGEIIRGFYYPAQPIHACPSVALARRLISWRLLANDRAQQELLAPAVRNELGPAAEQRTVDLLLSLGETWGQALDRFYLQQRMQGWVGVSAGARIGAHTPLYPFFDPAFLAAAMALPCADKLNSKMAYELLMRLDASLARRPLDSGITPARAPRTRLGWRAADMKLNGKKVAARLGRRLRGGGRATLGSETVNQRWHRLALYERLPLHGLTRTGLFDESVLDKIGRGELTPDRPTLGFLMVMAGLVSRA